MDAHDIPERFRNYDAPIQALELTTLVLEQARYSLTPEQVAFIVPTR